MDKKMNIKVDDLAVPELQFEEEIKEDDKKLNNEHEITIDYSGAVPEIHITGKK